MVGFVHNSKAIVEGYRDHSRFWLNFKLNSKIWRGEIGGAAAPNILK